MPARKRFVLLLSILLLPDPLFAQDAQGNFLRVERNRQTETDLRITSIGGFGVAGGKIGHVDLSYIESVDDGNSLVLDVGADVAFTAGADFFVGGGFLLGYNVDRNSVVSAYYPELGLAIKVTRQMGVTVTAKRYYNLYDRTEDAVMVGILLSER